MASVTRARPLDPSDSWLTRDASYPRPPLGVWLRWLWALAPWLCPLWLTVERRDVQGEAVLAVRVTVRLDWRWRWSRFRRGGGLCGWCSAPCHDMVAPGVDRDGLCAPCAGGPW